MDCAMFNEMKLADEKKRARELALCNLDRAKSDFEQGLLTAEEYRNAQRYHLFLSPNPTNLEAALRGGIISSPEYREFQRKYYIEVGQVSGRVALEGLCEGVIADDEWLAVSNYLWEVIDDSERAEPHGEFEFGRGKNRGRYILTPRGVWKVTEYRDGVQSGSSGYYEWLGEWTSEPKASESKF
jgi:hypothetical protein